MITMRRLEIGVDKLVESMSSSRDPAEADDRSDKVR